jgi:hypothetical protein
MNESTNPSREGIDAEVQRRTEELRIANERIEEANKNLVALENLNEKLMRCASVSEIASTVSNCFVESFDAFFDVAALLSVAFLPTSRLNRWLLVGCSTRGGVAAVKQRFHVQPSFEFQSQSVAGNGLAL